MALMDRLASQKYAASGAAPDRAPPPPRRSPVKAVQSLLIKNEGSAVVSPEFLARVADQVKVAGGVCHETSQSSSV